MLQRLTTFFLVVQSPSSFIAVVCNSVVCADIPFLPLISIVYFCYIVQLQVVISWPFEEVTYHNGDAISYLSNSRALEDRKKLADERENRKRELELAKRRQRQIEATERYQRAHMGVRERKNQAIGRFHFI